MLSPPKVAAKAMCCRSVRPFVQTDLVTTISHELFSLHIAFYYPCVGCGLSTSNKRILLDNNH